MPAAAGHPRVLVVMPAQWPRALLRASLREVGYDASGAHDVIEAARPGASDAGALRLLIVDAQALAGDTVRAELLDRLIGPDRKPLRLLIAPATGQPAAGAWDQVLHRPISIGEIVVTVESLLPLAPEARRPVD